MNIAQNDEQNIRQKVLLNQLKKYIHIKYIRNITEDDCSVSQSLTISFLLWFRCFPLIHRYVNELYLNNI